MWSWSSLHSPEGGVLSEGGSAVVRGEVHPEHHGVLAVAGHLTGLGAAQLQLGDCVKTTSPDGVVPRPELPAQRPEARLVVRPAAGEVDVASRQLASPLDDLHQ